MFCFEEVFWFEEVLLHRNSNTFYFSATRNQCNGETEMFCFEEVYFIGNLISSISLQQEISAIVKQKCFALKKFYFIGTLIPSFSLQQEISAMVKYKCFALKRFYFIRTLIPSISLQQEISAMVKQKCLYKVLLYRNSDIFYFSTTRNQCYG